MSTRKRTRRLLLASVLAMVLGAALSVGLPKAFADAKTVYIPASWQSTGEVPWAQNRTKESANFILLWGEKSGTTPTSAPSPYNFNPDNILSQLETLYSFYVNDLKFTPEAGALAQHKIVVIVTQTWNREALNAWATGGSAEGRIGVINIAPAAAAPGSWGLAHELGHVFQNLAWLGKPGLGFTHASAGTFWEASAEFMSMQVYPNGGAGDLTRFLRTENLAYSSSRHHYGAWMLIQYLVDKNGGVGIFNRMWNEARNTEHPLETYKRLAGLSQEQFNQQMAEYAQKQVTYDYSNRSSFMPFINNMYGGQFIRAYNGIAVDAVNQAAGHYAVPDALAPSDYGYNKIKLVPSVSGGTIRVHFKGHVNSAAGSGWSYGFVGVRNGTPRYGPVYTAADSQVSFQTQAGEEVYLVVVGAPTTNVHKYAFLDGYTKNYRYPYEFGISGGVPSGYEPGYQKPAPVGGRWHANGGGWVSNSANVSASAYVGPRAAVYGNSTVSENARIEGLAWVNSGATVRGNAVVKDNALIQGGANLSGNVVVGGDAEMGIACSSGTYLLFTTNRGCDGRAGETDINPTYQRFTDAEVAVTGGDTPAPNPTTAPTASPTPTATTPPTTAPTTPPTTAPTSPPTPGPTTTTTPPPAGAPCSATLAVVGTWQGGFQGEVTVTAGTAPVNGWAVSWPLASGQGVTQSWGAEVTTGGTTVTARNAAWNGSLTAGGRTTFGFIGTGAATSAQLTCTAA